MPNVGDVLSFLNRWAPVGTKMDFDNVGLLCGEQNAPVTRILTALDVTDRVIDEAVEMKAQLIVVHHPLFFGIKDVTDRTAEGRKIIRLIRNGISVISMHTNLDAAEGGVNTALAEALGIAEPRLIAVDGQDEEGRPYGIGRWGELAQEMSLEAFLCEVKSVLGVTGIRYVGRAPVHRLAVVGGSGGDYIDRALALGCDTLVTADVKYHQFLQAEECGLNLIDADHFCTENVVVPKLAEKLSDEFGDVDIQISQVHRQTVCFY